jgi:hypothetical protein
MTPHHPQKGFSEQKFLGGVMAFFLEKVLNHGK